MALMAKADFLTLACLWKTSQNYPCRDSGGYKSQWQVLLWQQRGQGRPGGAGWASVVCWDHSVRVGPEACLGMMGCQEMAQPGQFWAHWFCPRELDLVLLLHPVLVLLSLLCGQHSFLFFPLPPPPWPSVSWYLLLASSLRDSGQIGTSPFSSWEGTWLSSHLLDCFRSPFPHLLQHLPIFPELHMVFLDHQLGFRSREDPVSSLVFSICGDCIY